MKVLSKIIPAHQFADEPQLTLFHPGDRLAKLAYSVNDEIRAAVMGLRPERDVSYVLVNAMGAYESFGPNSNYDAFEEHELIPSYRTFEKARLFTDHANSATSPSRGSIYRAIWNKRMKRVELILRMPHDKNEEILTDLERGKPFGVSMGCRVSCDRCSICSNEAPTRLQYCKHILNELGHFYPDGRQVLMFNVKPEFFDLSVVKRPADKTGWAIEKVAAMGGAAVEHRFRPAPLELTGLSKTASEKSAEMEKRIPVSDILATGNPHELYAQIDRATTPDGAPPLAPLPDISDSDVAAMLKLIRAQRLQEAK